MSIGCTSLGPNRPDCENMLHSTGKKQSLEQAAFRQDTGAAQHSSSSSGRTLEETVLVTRLIRHHDVAPMRAINVTPLACVCHRVKRDSVNNLMKGSMLQE
jgi:hypothetical protein